MVGARLVEFSATASTDSAELLGTFEQTSVENWMMQGLSKAEIAQYIAYFHWVDARKSAKP
jgi:hypothetical protein